MKKLTLERATHFTRRRENTIAGRMINFVLKVVFVLGVWWNGAASFHF
jgi:hypothetical protein